MHSNRLPGYIEDIFASVEPAHIKAIGVSERPRRVEGSYMPCFLAGVNAAREIAAALKVPVYSFSHQEGHAAAVMEYGNVGHGFWQPNTHTKSSTKDS
jgi:N6-L-threonylcarbamoyladenine synthase